MAKRRRREHQHLGQESHRTKSAKGSNAQYEAYKPGFPMNIFGNVKLFAIIGVVVVISLVFVALLTVQNQDSEQADPLPTGTPTNTPDPNATPTATPDASASPTEGPKQFAAPEEVIDAETQDYEAVIETSKGTFTIALDAVNAPNTVNSFVFLAQEDYFDNTIFHRIVENFVIQGGDPEGTGTGGPGYTVQDEPNEISNTKYTLSMAKTRGASSFGSQFFINLKDNTTLDYNNPSDKFYPFAEVIEGQDVVDLIAEVGTPTGQPLEEVMILDVTINETPRAN